MELTILHLYPDCMSLYGEYANVAVLRRDLEGVGVSVTVETALFEDVPDFEHADLIYMGAGTERTQKAALSALLPHKDALKAAVDRGAVVLFTGSAMELLGKDLTDAAGRVWPCLGLADFATVETDKRDPGDVIACPDSLEWGGSVVGFMNKCSATHGVDTPLFPKLTLGFGNDADKGPEGYLSGNVFATHLTGPVLAKNPDFTDHFIQRLFTAKGWALPDRRLALTWERDAHRVTFEELKGRGGN